MPCINIYFLFEKMCFLPSVIFIFVSLGEKLGWQKHDTGTPKYIKKTRPCDQGKKRCLFQSLVSFFMYFFFFYCQTCFIWGIKFMLETKAIQVHLGFVSECDFFDILAAVIDRPLTGQLRKRRIALHGRDSPKNQNFCFTWQYVESLTAILPSFPLADNLSFANKIW